MSSSSQPWQPSPSSLSVSSSSEGAGGGERRDVGADPGDAFPLQVYDSVFRSDCLDGKVAFITGGGSGIGFRISEALMRHGCNVAIAARKLPRLQTAAKRLEAATGKRCLAIKLDVRDAPGVTETVRQVLRQLGRLDILVNAAAGNFLCPAASLSTNAFRTVMEIDTVGTFTVCKAAYDLWMRKHGGSIINITATLGLNGVPQQVHAGSAKAAIDAMTRHLANEWGPNGVRINSLAPGPIEDTEGYRKLGGFMPLEFRERYRRLIPVQRLGSRKEMADICVFLAGPGANYITGAMIIADGGSWMTTTSMHVVPQPQPAPPKSRL